MSDDFEIHDRGTAQELRILRAISEMVGTMLSSDPSFSLKELCLKHDELLKYYKTQPDYIPKKEL